MSKRDISDDIYCHYLAGVENKPKKNKQNRKKPEKVSIEKGHITILRQAIRKGSGTLISTLYDSLA